MRSCAHASRCLSHKGAPVEPAVPIDRLLHMQLRTNPIVYSHNGFRAGFKLVRVSCRSDTGHPVITRNPPSLRFHNGVMARAKSPTARTLLAGCSYSIFFSSSPHVLLHRLPGLRSDLVTRSRVPLLCSSTSLPGPTTDLRTCCTIYKPVNFFIAGVTICVYRSGGADGHHPGTRYLSRYDAEVMP